MRQAIAGVLVVSISMLMGSGAVVGEQQTTRQGVGKVYFVPLGELSFVSLDELIGYYRQKFGLTIEPLPVVPLEETMMDSARQQLIAEQIIASMKRQYPEHVNNSESILIGITEEDMYIRGKAWRFAFSYREEGRFAVVSSARMSLPSTSESRAAAQLSNPHAYKSPHFHSRFKKMLSKNIGVMHYQLPMNDNPRSVLYRSVMGIDELDTMGEDF